MVTLGNKQLIFSRFLLRENNATNFDIIVIINFDGNCIDDFLIKQNWSNKKKPCLPHKIMNLG